MASLGLGTPGAGAPPARRRWFAAALLALAVVSLYAPVLHHEFVNYDDDLYITDNPWLEQGLSRDGVSWAFRSVRGANWYPLTRLSFLAEEEIHGLSPAGVHATNVLLHAASAVLLLLALARMTGRLGASTAAAALFALHPFAVESVAWATERKGLLAGLFWMAALRVYAGVGRAPLSWRRSTAVALCLAACLMAKPVGVTLPFVLLLLDAWPLGRLHPGSGAAAGRAGVSPARALAEKAPLFALAAASAAATFVAQRAAGVVVAVEQLPLGQRFANAAVAYVTYLRRFLWPSDLAVFHPHPEGSLPAATVVFSLALLLGVTALALWQRWRRPWLLVGWLAYLGPLVPMLGLVQVGAQATADRYAYLPMVGLCVLAAWGGAELAGRGRARRAAVALATAGVLAALALSARQQLRHWRSSESLFTHALAVTKRNHVAHAQLGMALLAQGRTAEGLAQLRESLRVRPGYLEIANNLAWLLATLPDPALRDPDEAVALARAAAKQSGGQDPRVLDTLAAAHAAAGHFDRAVWFATLAIQVAARRGDEPLALAIRARLALYLAKQPYVEPPGAAPPPLWTEWDRAAPRSR